MGKKQILKIRSEKMRFGEDPKPLFAFYPDQLTNQQSSTLMSGCCSWSFLECKCWLHQSIPYLAKGFPHGPHGPPRQSYPDFGRNPLVQRIAFHHPYNGELAFETHHVRSACCICYSSRTLWRSLTSNGPGSPKIIQKIAWFLQQIVQSLWHVPQNLMTSTNQLHYHFWGPEAFWWGGFPKLCQPTNPDVAAS